MTQSWRSANWLRRMRKRTHRPWAAGDDADGQTEGGLQLVAAFLSLEEANIARGLLQSADIPCFFENEQAGVWSGIGELRLMVPAPAYDRACEILETQISEEELIAQAEAEASEAPEAPRTRKLPQTMIRRNYFLRDARSNPL